MLIPGCQAHSLLTIRFLFFGVRQREGRDAPLRSKQTGVLIRVEPGGARLDFGSRGKYLVPISKTDLYKVYLSLLGLAGGNNFVGALASQPPPPQTAAQGPSLPPPVDAFARVLGPMQAEIRGLGSNAVAIGKQISEGRRGQLLVNPHFPWQGPSRRFYPMHQHRIFVNMENK